jgi:hypothetical protein
MMDGTKGSESAFPTSSFGPDGDCIFQEGMSKREHMALKIMISLIGNPSVDGTAAILALSGVEWADKLLEALENKNADS